MINSCETLKSYVWVWKKCAHLWLKCPISLENVWSSAVEEYYCSVKSVVICSWRVLLHWEKCGHQQFKRTIFRASIKDRIPWNHIKRYVWVCKKSSAVEESYCGHLHLKYFFGFKKGFFYAKVCPPTQGHVAGRRVTCRAGDGRCQPVRNGARGASIAANRAVWTAAN